MKNSGFSIVQVWKTSYQCNTKMPWKKPPIFFYIQTFLHLPWFRCSSLACWPVSLEALKIVYSSTSSFQGMNISRKVPSRLVPFCIEGGFLGFPTNILSKFCWNLSLANIAIAMTIANLEHYSVEYTLEESAKFYSVHFHDGAICQVNVGQWYFDKMLAGLILKNYYLNREHTNNLYVLKYILYLI